MAITKITTPELFDFSATNTALQLPTGTTAQRPGTLAGTANPVAGEWRYNTTLSYVEYYDGTTPYDAAKWFQIDTDAVPNADIFPAKNFNVNTYTGNGGTQTLDAKFNEAANFGGAARIDLPQSILGSGTTKIWSTSFWFNTASATEQYMNNTAAFSSGKGYSVYIRATGHLQFSTSDGGGGSSEKGWRYEVATVNDGNWHNVVATYSSAGGTNDAFLYLYLDGADVTGPSTAINGMTQGSGPTYSSFTTPRISLGNWADSSAYPGGLSPLIGRMDQVRFYNTALPATGTGSVATLYAETTTTAATLNFPVGAGCIAAYQLDGDASDLSGTYGGVTTGIGYTGLKFQPDLVWIKNRTSAGYEHFWWDSVRLAGGNKDINSDSTNFQGEENTSAFGNLSSFDSNGFTVTSGTTNAVTVNNNTDGYVAWCWLAGGAPDATNSNAAGSAPTLGSVMIDGVKSTAALLGTIAAKKISANTAAGFSIVQHVANNSNDTIAHCLSSAPDLIISKQTDATGAWGVYNSANGTGNYLYLNDTDDIFAAANVYPTVNSTVFAPGSGGWNFGTGTYIHYCFANINGYQRISSYAGDGQASGPIIYTTSDGTATGTEGFEPALLLVKRTDSGDNWLLFDNKRNPVNPTNLSLVPNTGAADDVGNLVNGFTFLTNGFQVASSDTGVNASGGTYLFLAIAADKDSSVPTAANSLDTVIYTGTGTTAGDLLNVETSLTPSFVWVKNRNVAVNHYLYDSTRGTGDAKALHSNNTASQASASAYADNGGIAALSPNSFTAYRGSDGTYQGTNLNADNYVAWTWRAGGLPTINDDGDITSIVSANPAAGFSIVNYNGNGTAGGQKIGHGLEKTPELFFIKRLDAVSDWVVYSAALGGTKYLILDTTQSELTASDIFNDTSPSSTAPYVFTVGDHASVNATNGNYISYCFASCVGYVDIGSYSGLSTGTNTHVTGFEPSFVMIKGTNFADSWYMYDNKRRTPPSSILFADLSDVEYTTDNTALYVTFVSGGVGVGGFTTSGAFSGIDGATRDFIYIAIK